MAHRRDIEPAFMETSAEVYRAIPMRAQAATTVTLPRPDSGSSSSAVSTSVSSADDASTSHKLLSYPLLHESNYFDQEASGRKHARVLSNRVAVKRRGSMRLVNTKPIDAFVTVTASAHATRSHARKHGRQQRGVRSTSSVMFAMRRGACVN